MTAPAAVSEGDVLTPEERAYVVAGLCAWYTDPETPYALLCGELVHAGAYCPEHAPAAAREAGL